MVRFFIVFAALCLSAPLTFASTTDWTVAIYAGIDEEEIDQFSNPIIQEILGIPLHQNIELFIQKDSYGAGGVDRIYKHGKGPSTHQLLEEHDSADPRVFKDFVEWVDQHSTGRRRLFVIMTHAWGWKGIVQDYTVPNQKEDTMMALRKFADILRASYRPIDGLFLDSCVLGNAESIDELRGTARYIVASQRETPYVGYPYHELFAMLAQPELSMREVARRIPRQYVAAHSRGGSLVAREGEYDVVTAVAVDMEKWDLFVGEFATLVQKLKAAGFRRALRAKKDWASAFADTDRNVDVVEFLHRLPSITRSKAAINQARRLMQLIGYPNDVAQATAASYRIGASQADLVKVRIPVDEHLKPETAFEKSKKRWLEANQDLALPTETTYRIREGVLEVTIPLAKGAVEFRPWLPGVSQVRIAIRSPEDKSWRSRRLAREQDYFSVTEFPSTSFLLAEAHTQGAPFVHGIGMCLHPQMDETEERSTDPATGLSGPAFYRTLSWNERTGWGNLFLLNN